MPHQHPSRLSKSRTRTILDSSLSSSYTKTLLHSTDKTTSPGPSFDPKPHSLFSQNKNPRQTILCSFSSFCTGGSLWKFSCCSSSCMASREEVAVPVHVQPVGKKAYDGHQNIKEELETEVSMLYQMLDREKLVHKVLEGAMDRNCPLHIPSSLPIKMRELLAELVMVEEEIVRLEKEMKHLLQSLGHEHEVSKKFKTRQWQHGSLSNIEKPFSLPPITKPTFQGVPERVPFGPRALYFISKAIKGDNTLSDYSSKDMKESSGIVTENKEKHGDGEVRFHEKFSKKSGIQKSFSPKIAPRNSTSMSMELSGDISIGFPPMPVSSSNPSEDTNQKLQPNKLSESIMKCLIFIFVRLVRTSRAYALEKSSTTSRSPHSSLNFGVDIGSNSKPSHALQRESRQQDPYGVFNSEDSVPRDIGPYKNLVRFTSISLDANNINNSSSAPLIHKLRALMNNLQNVDLMFLTHEQKLAFWINMYNACIMHGFLKYGVPSNSDELVTLMSKATVQIGTYKANALTIERCILRQQSSPSFKDVYWKDGEVEKEVATHCSFRLESLEPNVAFALCSGTRSSPAVRIYTANGVLSELEKSKLDYLQASIGVTNTKRLVIPELLFQNMLNFACDVNSLVEWVCHQLPTSWSLRKLMVECFRAHNSGKISITVDKMPYDFDFQYLLAI